MEEIVKGKKGTYCIMSELVLPINGSIDIDVRIDIIVRDIENNKLVKKDRFALAQSSSNSELKELIERYKYLAKNDFKD